MQHLHDLFIERNLNKAESRSKRDASILEFHVSDELVTKYYTSDPLRRVNEIAWKDLRHPFITPFIGVQIFSDEKQQQRFKIFMKNVTINQDFLKFDELKHMYQYIRTVLYLRHKFLAHNDLSHDNVLVDKKTDNIQFIDFGEVNTLDYAEGAKHDEYVRGFSHGFNDVYSTLLRIFRSNLLPDYNDYFDNLIQYMNTFIEEDIQSRFKDTDGRYGIVIQQIANTLKHQLAIKNKNILINYHTKCNVMHEIAENTFNSIFLSEYPQHIFNEFLNNDANAISALGELLLTGMKRRFNDTKSEIFDAELQYCEIPQRTRTAYLLFKKAMQNFSTHAT